MIALYKTNIIQAGLYSFFSSDYKKYENISMGLYKYRGPIGK